LLTRLTSSNDSIVHWSVFGGYANSIRPEPYYKNVNNWTVLFDAKKSDIKKAKDATLTVSQSVQIMKMARLAS
jgi:rhamnogalacturonan endolyase